MFYICENVEECKAYRLIQLAAPLPGHFTLPLNPSYAFSIITFTICMSLLVVVMLHVSCRMQLLALYTIHEYILFCMFLNKDYN
jgi:hypothetical protein